MKSDSATQVGQENSLLCEMPGCNARGDVGPAEVDGLELLMCGSCRESWADNNSLSDAGDE